MRWRRFNNSLRLRYSKARRRKIKQKLPSARVITVTSDTMENQDEATTIIKDIIENKYNIIVGTQIIAKGHNFPHLTLVGVNRTDLAILGGDLRATEKTYQLLHQVSGRSGRSVDKGEVYLQTYDPTNPMIRALSQYQRDLFYNNEYKARKLTSMPPFSRLISIIIFSRDKMKAESTAIEMVKSSLHYNSKEISIMGPAPAQYTC